MLILRCCSLFDNDITCRAKLERVLEAAKLNYMHEFKFVKLIHSRKHT